MTVYVTKATEPVCLIDLRNQESEQYYIDNKINLFVIALRILGPKGAVSYLADTVPWLFGLYYLNVLNLMLHYT